ncbi:hypothetical protein [uncultured Psychroserpens sp.]|uniref:hypothetical protein n=1 Tax=uncultured Psychroserpens sp. TaxID=255436 RepID=UPI002619DC45|nr:hypothetical protein [uncultured Psychroserpens sp.]
MINKHPYGIRYWWRERLPWFLINLGIADKGKDCELVNAEHSWYNIDEKSSGCYYCKVSSKGQKWKS